jgi:hypothetical protein
VARGGELLDGAASALALSVTEVKELIVNAPKKP